VGTGNRDAGIGTGGLGQVEQEIVDLGQVKEGGKRWRRRVGGRRGSLTKIDKNFARARNFCRFLSGIFSTIIIDFLPFIVVVILVVAIIKIVIVIVIISVIVIIIKIPINIVIVIIIVIVVIIIIVRVIIIIIVMIIVIIRRLLLYDIVIKWQLVLYDSWHYMTAGINYLTVVIVVLIIIAKAIITVIVVVIGVVIIVIVTMQILKCF
jgi:hypothetical protein